LLQRDLFLKCVGDRVLMIVYLLEFTKGISNFQAQVMDLDCRISSSICSELVTYRIVEMSEEGNMKSSLCDRGSF
jgi:hypothetical protein